MFKITATYDSETTLTAGRESAIYFLGRMADGKIC